MAFLPTLAKGVMKSKDYHSVNDDLEKLKSSAQRLINRKGRFKEELDKSRKEFQTTMKALRKKVRTTFDKLQEDATKEMESLHDYQNEALSTEIVHCESLISDLEHCQSKLNDGTENEAQIFIRMKHIQKKLKQHKQSISGLSEDIPIQNMTFSVDTELERFLETLNSLGTFGTGEDKPRPSQTMTAKFRRKTGMLKKQLTPRCSGKVVTEFKSVDVRLRKDKEECCIQGICKLKDGNLVISDYNNKKLKLLNDLYAIVDACRMPSEPNGICAIAPSRNEIAVALDDCSIQFVSVTPKMKMTKIIKTNHGCYGMAYHNDNLFITECRGNTVYVHDIDGQHIQSIQYNMAGEKLFSCTHGLCIDGSQEEGLLYVVDKELGLVTLRLNWLSETRHPDMDEPHGVCTDTNGNVFVCGSLSHNIVQFADAGTRPLKVVASRSDGIKVPECVYFDSETSRLVVASSSSGECDYLSVMTME